MEISYCRNDSLFSAARVAALNKGAAIKPYQPEHLGWKARGVLDASYTSLAKMAVITCL